MPRILPLTTLTCCIPLLFVLPSMLSVGGKHHLAKKRKKNDSVTITAASTPAQTFAGFGGNLINQFNMGKATPSPSQYQDMANKIWKPLKSNAVRLWVDPPGTYAKNKGDRTIAPYLQFWMDKGLLPAIRQAGATTTVLCSTYFPDYDLNGKTPSQGGLADYADILATFVKQFHDRTGLNIDYVEMVNEPGTDKHPYLQLDDWATLLKYLRADLDREGFQKTGSNPCRIMGPTKGNTDATAIAIIEQIAKDPVAWDDLDVISVHSYVMGATPEMVAAARGKPVWCTESGEAVEGTESDKPYDAFPAAYTCSHFLSDLNSGVTEWLYWSMISYDSRASGQSTSTSYWNVVSPDVDLVVLQKWYSLKALLDTFQPGCKIRVCQSSSDAGALSWVHGHQVKIFASVAQNTDGTWGVGLLNYTSDIFKDPTTYLQSVGADNPNNEHNLSTQFGTEPDTYNVTVKIPELEGTNTTFQIYKCNSSGPATSVGKVIMKNGRMTITNVRPLDIFTARSEG